MTEVETKNAKIVGTFLGYEDHGIPTCFLYLDYGGGKQGFGGHDLKFYGVEYILRILEVVGVASWEDLKGKSVRVRASLAGVDGIGHYLKDDWFYPEADKEEEITP